MNWHEIFELPYKNTTEPYLQSYQYKILNRILNCNERLYKWKIKMGPECDSCGMIDTIEHCLFYCKKSKEIWVALQSWMGTVLETNTEFTICEVIFGITTKEDHYTQLINYIILISKWYINKNKEQGKLLGILTKK